MFRLPSTVVVVAIVDPVRRPRSGSRRRQFSRTKCRASRRQAVVARQFSPLDRSSVPVSRRPPGSESNRLVALCAVVHHPLPPVHLFLDCVVGRTPPAATTSSKGMDQTVRATAFRPLNRLACSCSFPSPPHPRLTFSLATVSTSPHSLAVRRPHFVGVDCVHFSGLRSPTFPPHPSCRLRPARPRHLASTRLANSVQPPSPYPLPHLDASEPVVDPVSSLSRPWSSFFCGPTPPRRFPAAAPPPHGPPARQA